MEVLKPSAMETFKTLSVLPKIAVHFFNQYPTIPGKKRRILDTDYAPSGSHAHRNLHLRDLAGREVEVES